MIHDSDRHLTQNPIIPEGINATPHNPFKELLILSSSVIVIFVVISFLVWQGFTRSAQHIPLAWELRLAQSIAPTPESVSESQIELQARVDRILQALEYDAEIPIRVHLFEGDLVNAFATLGGQIFVFEGLLNAVETDIGLDMVLAHEVAHIINRDPIRVAAGAFGIQLLFSLVTGSGEVSQMGGLMDAGGQLFLLSFSREQERAADELALIALQTMYGTLEGADELFVYIESLQGDLEFPEFFSSHPHPEARIEAIREQMNN